MFQLFHPLNNELKMVLLTRPTIQELVVTLFKTLETYHHVGLNHEEADPRIITAYCLPVEHGFNNILVQCVDTDVAALAVATVQGIAIIEIGIAFGTEKDYVPVHEISASLSPRKSLALLVFHPFTGCDTVSHFVQGRERMSFKYLNVINVLLVCCNKLYVNLTQSIVVRL